jgi:hypothetical protein
MRANVVTRVRAFRIDRLSFLSRSHNVGNGCLSPPRKLLQCVSASRAPERQPTGSSWLPMAAHIPTDVPFPASTSGELVRGERLAAIRRHSHATAQR